MSLDPFSQPVTGSVTSSAPVPARPRLRGWEEYALNEAKYPEDQLKAFIHAYDQNIRANPKWQTLPAEKKLKEMNRFLTANLLGATKKRENAKFWGDAERAAIFRRMIFSEDSQPIQLERKRAAQIPGFAERQESMIPGLGLAASTGFRNVFPLSTIPAIMEASQYMDPYAFHVRKQRGAYTDPGFIQKQLDEWTPEDPTQKGVQLAASLGGMLPAFGPAGAVSGAAVNLAGKAIGLKALASLTAKQAARREALAHIPKTAGTLSLLTAADTAISRPALTMGQEQVPLSAVGESVLHGLPLAVAAPSLGLLAGKAMGLTRSPHAPALSPLAQSGAELGTFASAPSLVYGEPSSPQELLAGMLPFAGALRGTPGRLKAIKKAMKTLPPDTVLDLLARDSEQRSEYLRAMREAGSQQVGSDVETRAPIWAYGDTRPRTSAPGQPEELPVSPSFGEIMRPAEAEAAEAKRLGSVVNRYMPEGEAPGITSAAVENLSLLELLELEASANRKASRWGRERPKNRAEALEQSEDLSAATDLNEALGRKTIFLRRMDILQPDERAANQGEIARALLERAENRADIAQYAQTTQTSRGVHKTVDVSAIPSKELYNWWEAAKSDTPFRDPELSKVLRKELAARAWDTEVQYLERSLGVSLREASPKELLITMFKQRVRSGNNIGAVKAVELIEAELERRRLSEGGEQEVRHFPMTATPQIPPAPSRAGRIPQLYLPGRPTQLPAPGVHEVRTTAEGGYVAAPRGQGKTPPINPRIPTAKLGKAVRSKMTAKQLFGNKALIQKLRDFGFEDREIAYIFRTHTDPESMRVIQGALAPGNLQENLEGYETRKAQEFLGDRPSSEEQLRAAEERLGGPAPRRPDEPPEGIPGPFEMPPFEEHAVAAMEAFKASLQKKAQENFAKGLHKPVIGKAPRFGDNPGQWWMATPERVDVLDPVTAPPWARSLEEFTQENWDAIAREFNPWLHDYMARQARGKKGAFGSQAAPKYKPWNPTEVPERGLERGELTKRRTRETTREPVEPYSTKLLRRTPDEALLSEDLIDNLKPWRIQAARTRDTETYDRLDRLINSRGYQEARARTPEPTEGIPIAGGQPTYKTPEQYMEEAHYREAIEAGFPEAEARELARSYVEDYRKSTLDEPEGGGIPDPFRNPSGPPPDFVGDISQHPEFSEGRLGKPGVPEPVRQPEGAGAQGGEEYIDWSGLSEGPHRMGAVPQEVSSPPPLPEHWRLFITPQGKYVPVWKNEPLTREGTELIEQFNDLRDAGQYIWNMSPMREPDSFKTWKASFNPERQHSVLEPPNIEYARRAAAETFKDISPEDMKSAFDWLTNVTDGAKTTFTEKEIRDALDELSRRGDRDSLAELPTEDPPDSVNPDVAYYNAFKTTSDPDDLYRQLRDHIQSTMQGEGQKRHMRALNKAFSKWDREARESLTRLQYVDYFRKTINDPGGRPKLEDMLNRLEQRTDEYGGPDRENQIRAIRQVLQESDYLMAGGKQAQSDRIRALETQLLGTTDPTERENLQWAIDKLRTQAAREHQAKSRKAYVGGEQAQPEPPMREARQDLPPSESREAFEDLAAWELDRTKKPGIPRGPFNMPQPEDHFYSEGAEPTRRTHETFTPEPLPRVGRQPRVDIKNPVSKAAQQLADLNTSTLRKIESVFGGHGPQLRWKPGKAIADAIYNGKLHSLLARSRVIREWWMSDSVLEEVAPEYLEFRNQIEEQGYADEAHAAEVRNYLETRYPTRAQREELFHQMSDPMNPPLADPALETLRELIMTDGEELVRLKIIPRGVYEQYKGNYIKHIRANYPMGFITDWMGGRRSTGNRLPRFSFHRGISSRMSREDLEDRNQNWQEVRRETANDRRGDPRTALLLENERGGRVWLSEDAAGSYLENWRVFDARPDANGKLGVVRDRTPYELKRDGIEKDLAAAMQATRKAQLDGRRKGELLEWVAGNPQYAKKNIDGTSPYDGWRLAQNSAVAGEGSINWGKLNNHWVHPDVYRDLTVSYYLHPTLEALRSGPVGKTMGVFKRGKTTWSPKAQIRQVAQNLLIHELNGGSLADIPEAFSHMAKQSDLFQELHSHGAYRGMQVAVDLAGGQRGEWKLKGRLEALNQTIKEGDVGGVLRALDNIGREYGPTALWNANDTLFRTALAVNLTRNGVSIKDAADYVAHFTYHGHRLPLALELAKNTVLPWVNVPYWAMRYIPRIMLEHPLRAAQVIGLAYALSAVAEGDESEEFKKAKVAAGPEHIKKAWTLFPKAINLPWKDSRGRQTELDLTVLDPTQPMLNPKQALSGPVTTAGGLLLNLDPGTIERRPEPVWKEPRAPETSLERTKDILSRTMLPGFVQPGYELAHTIREERAKPGRTRFDVGTAARRLLIDESPVDLGRGKDSIRAKYRSMINDSEKEIYLAKIQRKQGRISDEQYKVIRERQKRVRKDLIRKYHEEVSPIKEYERVKK